MLKRQLDDNEVTGCLSFALSAILDFNRFWQTHLKKRLAAFKNPIFKDKQDYQVGKINSTRLGECHTLAMVRVKIRNSGLVAYL